MKKDIDQALQYINPMVCYNSRVKMLNRLINARYDAALKPYRLTGSQFTLLLFIGKAKSTNQKMIADLLMINFTTVSREVAKIKIAAWIVFEKAIDARNSQISLSEKGRALLTEVLPVWANINNEMEGLLGDVASAGLNNMINALRAKK
ncbi:MarR family winged helix-turn-helix transcriptional regulator [Mucilaginibacter sp. HD30]